MTDRELLETILHKIGSMDERIISMDERITGIEGKITGMDAELKEVKNDLKHTRETVIKIEIEHGKKLGALFDGQKLISEKLDRIESEVTRHEEIIMRRIR